MTLVPLSVVIITHNEEAMIGRTIEAAKKISEDIIVVDSNSTDQTREIALGKGARVYEKKWEGYSAQKNYGNSMAKHTFIVSIDADEVITEELAGNILKEFESPSSDCYKIYFTSIFLGKKIKYGDWRSDAHVRIFDKSKISWNVDPVHEALVIPDAAKTGIIAGKIDHYSYTSLEQYLAKSNSYTSMHASKLFKAGKKAGVTKIFLSPVFKFIKGYFFRLGFLDGFEGFLVAALSAQSVFIKYSKLKILHQSKKIR